MPALAPRRIAATIAVRMPSYGLYVRDQWQVSRKLILNFGTRWEYYPFATRDHRGGERYDPATDKALVGPPAGHRLARHSQDRGSRRLRNYHRSQLFPATCGRRFRERITSQFRWEVFNATNTPTFGQPSATVTSSGFAEITSASGTERRMRFALKLLF